MLYVFYHNKKKNKYDCNNHKKLETPQCPSSDEWINQLEYILQNTTEQLKKKKKDSCHAQHGWIQMHDSKWKKPDF